MADVKYEKLDRIREDIKRDKAKVAKLQEQIKVKEAKLKEAEASQIVADVGAMNMTPEQLGEFLALIQSGNLNELLSGKTKVVTTVNSSEVNEEKYEDLYEDEEHINPKCPVCSYDYAYCEGKEPEVTETEDETEEPEVEDPKPEKKNNSGMIVIVLLVIGGAAGGYFYITKAKNKKPAKNSGVDPDADYNEDEEE